VPPPAFRLLLVTDRKLARRPLPELVETALASAAPGLIAVQLREKDLEARALAELARALVPVCRARGAPLLVNDRLDVALAVGAGGVHLPQASFKADDARRLLGPDKLVGVSCHSIEEVRDAKGCGAGYATFGPVFDTPSKRRFGPPVGLERLREAARLSLPLYGLGGVGVDNAGEVLEGGAAGVAAIGAWVGSSAEALPGVVRALLGT